MKLKCSTLWLMLACLFSASAQTPDTCMPPRLTQSKAWSIILLPDLQTYNKFGRNQGISELMTAWTTENLERLNVLTVLQNGDLVEHNDIEQANGKNGNQNSTQQWRAVSRAFERLDGRTPYVLATGNHDYGTTNGQNRDTQFPKYFPVERNPAWKGVLVECCTNRIGEKTLENAAYQFTTPGGRKLLILSLEFAPSDPVLAWAKELVARDAYKDSLVILMTHAYMKSYADSNALIVKAKYKLEDANYGQAVWDKLIFPSDNIRLVICGHIAKPDSYWGSVGFRVDKNHAGKNVSQMLFNAQANGGGWHGNGGDGWLRILEFDEDGKTISVRTFSPLFAISPSTQHLAWRTEPYDRFVIELEE